MLSRKNSQRRATMEEKKPYNCDKLRKENTRLRKENEQLKKYIEELKKFIKGVV